MARGSGKGTEPFKTCECKSKTRCTHSWVYRWYADGKQSERRFPDDVDAAGRRNYGSGKEAAKRFAASTYNRKVNSTGNGIDPSAGKVLFTEYAQIWIDRRTAPASVSKYSSVLRNHMSAIGKRTLAQVGSNPEAAQKLLDGIPVSARGTARSILTGTCTWGVKNKKIGSHDLIRLEVPPPSRRVDLTPTTFEQLAVIAENMGDLSLIVWLGAECGLRPGESLGVVKSDFIDDFHTLRLVRQRRDNHELSVMKARKADDYRDIPVPAHLRSLVVNLPDGPLTPDRSRACFNTRFIKGKKAAGITDHFTPHSLRHRYASTTLEHGATPTDICTFMGEKSLDLFFQCYQHMIPSAFGRARAILDSQFPA